MNPPTYLPYLDPLQTEFLYTMLNRITVPLVSGKSGRATSFGSHRGMMLGYVRTRIGHRYQLSRNSRKYPDIYQEVVRIGQLICPFEFDAIQLNHNVVCTPHKDRNNVGESVIISFGDYAGGELNIEGYGEFDTSNHPLIFDGGKITHWNNPIIGNKYSLVFFNNSKP